MNATMLDAPLEPGSDQWLQTISASQIATIVGLSPWSTPHELYHLKRGTMTRSPKTDAQKRGHELEPLIATHWCDMTGRKAVSTGTWRNNDRPWQTANPDRLTFPGELIDDGPDGVLEIKSVHPEKVYEWRDGVPAYYLVQVVWQLDTLALPTGVVAMSSGYELFDRKPREYVVEWDEQTALWLRQKASEFLDMCAMGIEPPADFNRQCDRDVLRHKHPVIEDAGVEIPRELAEPFLRAIAAAKEIDGNKARWSAELANFLGDAKKATYQGVTLGSRRSGKNGPYFATAARLNPADLLNPKESAA